MNRRQSSIAFSSFALLAIALSAASCTSEEPFDSQADDEQNTVSASEELREPGVERHDNSAPCGDRTLAVVNAKSGATYVFCALEDGTMGVLEELPAGAAAESLVDVFPTAADLLRAVAPEGQRLPDALVAAMEPGAIAAPKAPVVLGIAARPDVPSLSGACASAQTFSNTYGFSSYRTFMEEFVADVEDCSLHVWYTDDYPLVSSSQVTASAHAVYEDYGPPYGTACAAKEHIASCGGSTLFQAFRQENPGDAWVTSLNYWVSDGGVATWKMYASDCDISHDRDDMRFKGNSEPGAKHRFSTIFNKWFGGAQCVLE